MWAKLAWNHDFVKWVSFSSSNTLPKNWKEKKKPYNSSRIRIWWSFSILTFCAFMLNPFLLPSPCCLSWRKVSTISHKDICGWRTQLTLCLLITSLDLSEGRGSEVEGLTGSDSLASQAQIPLHEDKPLAKQAFQIPSQSRNKPCRQE